MKTQKLSKKVRTQVETSKLKQKHRGSANLFGRVAENRFKLVSIKTWREDISAIPFLEIYEGTRGHG